MSETARRSWPVVRWGVVLRGGVFLGLVIGVSIVVARMELAQILPMLHRVDQRLETVQHTTAAVKEDTATATTILNTNKDLLAEHTDLTAENARMLAHLEPLFRDIVQRQYTILQAQEQQQRTLESHMHLFTAMQEQMRQLVALHERMMEQCPPVPPPQ